MLQQFERDLSFRVDDHYDLTKDEQRKRVMTRVNHERGDGGDGGVVAEHDQLCQQ